jgi:hypothetical protein
MKTPCFMNKIRGFFDEGIIMPNEILQFSNKIPGKGKSGTTYKAYYRSDGGVHFVNLRLSINYMGLRVMRDKMFLNCRVQGLGFDGFGDEATYVIQRGFSKRFI